MTDLDAPESGFAVIHAAILGCDYRLAPAGLERECGCAAEVVCLLRRGRWPDAPHAVDYGVCVECVTPSATWSPAGPCGDCPPPPP